MLMKSILLLLTLTLIGSFTWAATNVSPKFDGIYRGTANPTPGMSRPECVPFTASFVIKSGLIRKDTSAAVVFDGFVTEEGFVHGHVREGSKAPVLMEGRIVDDMLTAGALDEAAGCAWTLKLQRVQSPTAPEEH
jgi:hypothetical protein